jgi:hypothetical protein
MVRIFGGRPATPVSLQYSVFQGDLFTTGISSVIQFHKRDGSEWNKFPIAITLIHHVQHICLPDEIILVKIGCRFGIGNFHSPKIDTHAGVRKDSKSTCQKLEIQLRPKKSQNIENELQKPKF